MGLAVDIVKRGGRRPAEAFNKEKLRRSIHAACLSIRTPEGQAETTAKNVTHHVTIWLENKQIVTSHDLRRIVGLHLERYHPDAAYFYKHHRHIV